MVLEMMKYYLDSVVCNCLILLHLCVLSSECSVTFFSLLSPYPHLGLKRMTRRWNLVLTCLSLCSLMILDFIWVLDIVLMWLLWTKCLSHLWIWNYDSWHIYLYSMRGIILLHFHLYRGFLTHFLAVLKILL